MAVLITTQRQSFKIVPNDADQHIYYLVDKKDLVFRSTVETAGELYISGIGNTSIATTSTDTTGDGVTLATSAAVSNWITSNR